MGDSASRCAPAVFMWTRITNIFSGEYGLLLSSLGMSGWLRMGALAAIYFTTAIAGFSLALDSGTVTLFWPPSGIALAALLLFGRRLWPGIFIGSFCATLGEGLPLLAVAGIAVGNTAAALFGASLLGRKFGFNRYLGSVQDVLRLLIFGALISTELSAANGAFWLETLDGKIEWQDYGQTFLFLWMGDVLGVVLFAPAVIALYRQDPLEWTPSLRRLALLMFSILFFLCVTVFTDFGRHLFGHQFKAFIIIPVIIWAALGFNLRITSLALLITYAISLLGIVAGVGQFANASVVDTVDVWLYNIIIGVIGLSVAMVHEQRSRAYNKLEQSERNFRRAQRVVNMGSWQLDMGRNELTCSDEVYAIFGIANTGQPLGKEKILDAVHPDDRHKMDAAWQRLMRGEPCSIELRIVVDGQIKWVRQTIDVDSGHAGRPVTAFGTVRDITRRKLTEENLRLAANVFEGSGEAIMITDADEKIISVNHAFIRSSGYSLEEIKGRNPRILSSGKHDADFFRSMRAALTRDGYWQGEIWDKDKSGRVFPKLMSISAIKDEHGIVTHYISIAADITERKEAEKNIHALAYFDVLTSLPNRILLHDRIEQLVASSHRDQQKFALLFVDLDRFKYVNDSMGHGIGDKLLQVVAQRLTECVREGDTVSRIGGDEFVVLLRETGADGAASVAGKILEYFAVVSDIEGTQISTHASIGISIYPDHATDAETMIKNADVAMYCAKEQGRNNFQFFTPDLDFHARRLFSMEKDLRLALERNEFLLHYQPQLDLATGKVCGAEALLRWNHPEKGSIAPVDFIPVAEETGQILPVGEWVLRTACRQLAEWRQQGMAVFPISVNLSVRQLRQADLAQLVNDVLQETRLRPDDLELEITEGIMMVDTQASMAFLTQMHELGVRLSIDDFGTGFSSLSYLKRMPLDRLKIDQSFVRDIEIDENDAAIVRSIISLGHRFKLRVIAEGVETLEQMDFLRIRGCDEVQGFYFSHPLPADEFVKFIKNNLVP